MIKSIVLWLLGVLEQSLDPELQAKVQAARTQAAALEAERLRLLKDIAEAARVNALLDQTRMANIAERSKLEEAIAQAEADLAKRKADRARLSDADKLELDV